MNTAPDTEIALFLRRLQRGVTAVPEAETISMESPTTS